MRATRGGWREQSSGGAVGVVRRRRGHGGGCGDFGSGVRSTARPVGDGRGVGAVDGGADRVRLDPGGGLPDLFGEGSPAADASVPGGLAPHRRARDVGRPDEGEVDQVGEDDLVEDEAMDGADDEAGQERARTVRSTRQDRRVP